MRSPLAGRTRAADLNFERRGSGEPLILLHGIGGELCVWEPVLEPLAERLEVIAVDLPGFGRSPALPDEVSPTPQVLAGSIAGLMDELGLESAHLAGNSLGGWIALELGKGARARSVTGLCPAGLWGAPLRAAGPPAKGRTHALARSLRWLLPVLTMSRRVRRLALAGVVADADRVPRHAARRMISSYARATAYEATRTAMLSSAFTGAEQIRVPLTLGFGELDRLIRPLRLSIPGARSVVLPGCGHIPMWDDPALVTKLILATVGRGMERSEVTGRAARAPG
jgi:pimeloyl-ACP methyl ester carboxylesterase